MAVAVTGLAAGCAGDPSDPDGRGPDGPDGTGPGPTGDTSDTGAPAAAPPIVYVYVDQLRFDAPRYAGNPVGVTPNLDAFAAEAVAFTRCVTNAPSCRAARTTMITGLHVFAHKVWDNTIKPDPALQSHVRKMRDEAGYFAMVVGKTHLHDATGHMDDHLDELVAWGFTDAVELPDPQQWNSRSAHSDWLTDTTPQGEPDKYRRWQDYILDYTWDAVAPDEPPYALATADHLDTFCGRVAADFVRAYADERPLYLQVCFPGPHKPFDPTTELLALIDPDDPAMPLPVLDPPVPPIAPLVQTYLVAKDEEEAWTEASARALRQHYYAKVALVDRGIGELFTALRDAGLYDRAWIIVHSDHGELIADHQLTGKVLSFEGAIRVPLLVKPPLGAASAGLGWSDEGQVDQMDVTATLLAAAGLDPAGFGDRDLRGRVLGGASGPEAHASKPVMFENLGTVGIRDGDHKLSWDLGSGLPVEYYDLASDPGERANRVLDPAVRAPLQALIDTLRLLRPLPVDNWPG